MLRNPVSLQPPHQVPAEGLDGGELDFRQVGLCQAGERSV